MIDETEKASIISEIDKNYDKVKEGKAEVYFQKQANQVFYNPIQEFNRDLSISVLNTYSSLNKNKKLRILEALAASGIRSMRYALEIDNCSQIVANDFDKKAVELIDLNTKLNNVAHIVKSNYDDAIVLMNKTYGSKEYFDCIDLDPYGSPANFLDSSIRTIKSGGLLLVTATDAGVLCGNGADTCYTKYGSFTLFEIIYQFYYSFKISNLNRLFVS
jgi:tRNA (guanine26-N2/guanine27-N2)-dimethyltransferase